MAEKILWWKAYGSVLLHTTIHHALFGFRLLAEKDEKAVKMDGKFWHLYNGVFARYTKHGRVWRDGIEKIGHPRFLIDAKHVPRVRYALDGIAVEYGIEDPPEPAPERVKWKIRGEKTHSEADRERGGLK